MSLRPARSDVDALLARIRASARNRIRTAWEYRVSWTSMPEADNRFNPVFRFHDAQDRVVLVTTMEDAADVLVAGRPIATIPIDPPRRGRRSRAAELASIRNRIVETQCPVDRSGCEGRIVIDAAGASLGCDRCGTTRMLEVA